MLLLGLSGCTSLNDLQEPRKILEFTINEDVVVFYTAGIVKTRHSRGLLKGTYKIIAEDSEGYYFTATNGKIIRLSGPLAEEYERTKIYPEMKEVGFIGLWVPKDNSQKDIDMFLVTGVADISDHYQPGRGGAITYGVSHLLNESVFLLGEPKLPDLSNILTLIKSQNK